MRWDYKILNDGRDRELWLAARENTLGASEAAMVCGFSRFGSPLSLYADKVMGRESFGSPITRFGQIYERQIVKDFARDTGRIVKLDGRLLASVERPWQSCTLDAVQQPHAAFIGRGLAEVKTSLYGWEAIDGKDYDGIPAEYYCQIQHQFAVTGFLWGSAVMFNRTNCELIYQDVSPDAEYIEKLIEIESTFWFDHVLAGKPPAVDAHKATSEALKRIYPIHTDGEVITFPIDLLEKRDRRAWIGEEQGRLKEEKDGIDNQFKSAIGSAEGGAFPDGSGFTWKANKNGAKSLRVKERF